jgi:SAM-dependent methyltransferase
MSPAIDYEQIAHLYDSYLYFEDDLPFFLQECRDSGSVLELMCGTGRISIPLLEAGVNLTCVDSSSAMLSILRQKLAAKKLTASVVQGDVTCLKLEQTFELVILPFQGFHELCTEAEQKVLLSSIARLLKPNGRFICTLHNPKVRLQSAGQTPTRYGPFSRTDGMGSVALSVELDYEPETGIATGWQTVYELDSAGQEVAEHRLPLRFSLIEFNVFQELVQSAGLAIENLFGNYDRSPFVPQTSPYIIVSASKVVAPE